MNIKVNACGITRNRYSHYLKSKGRKELKKKRFSKAHLRRNYDEEDLIKSNLLSPSTRASEIELTETCEASWMADYRKCCRLLTDIDNIKQAIREERVRKMSSMEEGKLSKAIDKLHDEASMKISQCEKTMKSMRAFSESASTAEQTRILSNVLISLAIKTRERTQQLRDSQQRDLQQTKQLQQLSPTSLEGHNLMNKDEDCYEFDQEGFLQLEQSLNEERNEEIIKIVSSVYSLNTIYKQLQRVVIEQGSLLDRIDENVDNAASNISSANEHLRKAEQHQKSPFANRVICLLVALIAGCLLILFIRSR